MCEKFINISPHPNFCVDLNAIGTVFQTVATATPSNGFLADNQFWKAQGLYFPEIYVCKSPQGAGRGVHVARGLKCTGRGFRLGALYLDLLTSDDVING